VLSDEFLQEAVVEACAIVDEELPGENSAKNWRIFPPFLFTAALGGL